jgi:hypothetical protein
MLLTNQLRRNSVAAAVGLLAACGGEGAERAQVASPDPEVPPVESQPTAGGPPERTATRG